MYAPFAINVFARAVYLGFSGRGGVEDPESLHARATSVDSVMSTDTLAEWLRRRPAKPMGSPRVGSNPTGVDWLEAELMCDGETEFMIFT